MVYVPPVPPTATPTGPVEHSISHVDGRLRRDVEAVDNEPSKTAPAFTGPTPVITSFPYKPLTTEFVRPDSCAGIYTEDVWMVDGKDGCMPSGFDSNPTQFYSPGFICPKDYTTACHDTAGVSSITTVICCPRVNNDLILSCPQIPWPNRRGWDSYFCTYSGVKGGTAAAMATVSPNGITTTTAVTFSYPEGLNAYGVRLVYQAGDVGKFTSTSRKSESESESDSSTKPTSSSTSKKGGDKDGKDNGGGDGGDHSSTSRPDPANPTPSPGAGNSTISPPPPAANSAGLSSTGKVAVGVAVPVACAFVLAAILFFFWRRHKKNEEGQGGNGNSQLSNGSNRTGGGGGPPDMTQQSFTGGFAPYGVPGAAAPAVVVPGPPQSSGGPYAQGQGYPQSNGQVYPQSNQPSPETLVTGGFAPAPSQSGSNPFMTATGSQQGSAPSIPEIDSAPREGYISALPTAPVEIADSRYRQ